MDRILVFDLFIGRVFCWDNLSEITLPIRYLDCDHAVPRVLQVVFGIRN